MSAADYLVVHPGDRRDDRPAPSCSSTWASPSDSSPGRNVARPASHAERTTQPANRSPARLDLVGVERPVGQPQRGEQRVVRPVRAVCGDVHQVRARRARCAWPAGRLRPRQQPRAGQDVVPDLRLDRRQPQVRSRESPRPGPRPLAPEAPEPGRRTRRGHDVASPPRLGRSPQGRKHRSPLHETTSGPSTPRGRQQGRVEAGQHALEAAAHHARDGLGQERHRQRVEVGAEPADLGCDHVDRRQPPHRGVRRPGTTATHPPWSRANVTRAARPRGAARRAAPQRGASSGGAGSAPSAPRASGPRTSRCSRTTWRRSRATPPRPPRPRATAAPPRPAAARPAGRRCLRPPAGAPAGAGSRPRGRARPASNTAAGEPLLQRDLEPEPGQRRAVHGTGGAQVEGAEGALVGAQLGEPAPDLAGRAGASRRRRRAARARTSRACSRVERSSPAQAGAARHGFAAARSRHSARAARPRGRGSPPLLRSAQAVGERSARSATPPRERRARRRRLPVSERSSEELGPALPAGRCAAGRSAPARPGEAQRGPVGVPLEQAHSARASSVSARSCSTARRREQPRGLLSGRVGVARRARPPGAPAPGRAGRWATGRGVVGPASCISASARGSLPREELDVAQVVPCLAGQQLVAGAPRARCAADRSCAAASSAPPRGAAPPG